MLHPAMLYREERVYSAPVTFRAPILASNDGRYGGRSSRSKTEQRRLPAVENSKLEDTGADWKLTDV
jgi:hypothetical protein